MKEINPYLHFNGTTREAMNFYKDCLGGELFMQTVEESGMKDKMPPEMNKPGVGEKIMHARLSKDGHSVLMAADMMDPSSFKIGDNFTVSIQCESEKEIKELFEKLSEGGKVVMPLREEFWGALFGTLTDKFGTDWMLNYDLPKVK